MKQEGTESSTSYRPKIPQWCEQEGTESSTSYRPKSHCGASRKGLSLAPAIDPRSHCGAEHCPIWKWVGWIEGVGLAPARDRLKDGAMEMRV